MRNLRYREGHLPKGRSGGARIQIQGSDSRARLNSTRYNLSTPREACEQVWVFASTHWYYNLLAPSVCWTNHITIQRPLLGTAGEYSLAIPPSPQGGQPAYAGQVGLASLRPLNILLLGVVCFHSVFLPSRWTPWDQEIWNTTHTHRQTDRHTHTHVLPSKHKWFIWEVIPDNSWEEGTWNSKGKGVNTKCLMGLVTSVGNGWHVLIPSFDMSHWMTCSDSHLSNTYSQTLQAKHWGKGGDI